MTGVWDCTGKEQLLAGRSGKEKKGPLALREERGKGGGGERMGSSELRARGGHIFPREEKRSKE